MSLVNAYVTQEFIVMTGDLRRVHIVDNDDTYDDAPKLFTLNNETVIGYTGDYDVTIKLRKHLDNDDVKAKCSEEIASLVSRWLKDNAEEDSQQRIIIGGIRDGLPTLFQIAHDNSYEIEQIQAEPGRINWLLAYANINPEPYITEELGKLDGATVETITELASVVNRRVAAVDSFVSSECDTGVIE